MAVGLVEKGRDIHGSRAGKEGDIHGSGVGTEGDISLAVWLVERETYPWEYGW